ncbi:flavin reductase [Pseudomonas sp. LB3P14]
MTEQSPFETREFRNALGSFATGVTIITARGADGEPVGVTASSFNSVSLSPPLVLWSLSKSARSFEAFDTASHWAVHVLAADQDALSNRFAKTGEDKFLSLETDTGAGDVPLLRGCTSSFQCKTTFKYEGGDHLIFVGEVVAYASNEKPPLVFHGGKYALAARMTAPAALSSKAGQVSHDSSTADGNDLLGYLLWRANTHFREEIAVQMREESLDDDGFMALARLQSRDCSQAQLCAEMRWSGPTEVQTRLAALFRRGLLKDIDGRLSVTDAGRACFLRVDAASRAIETDLLERMSEGEALAFKHMLRRFIVDTDGGLPHPWEEVRVDGAAAGH